MDTQTTAQIKYNKLQINFKKKLNVCFPFRVPKQTILYHEILCHEVKWRAVEHIIGYLIMKSARIMIPIKFNCKWQAIVAPSFRTNSLFSVQEQLLVNFQKILMLSLNIYQINLFIKKGKNNPGRTERDVVINKKKNFHHTFYQLCVHTYAKAKKETRFTIFFPSFHMVVSINNAWTF